MDTKQRELLGNKARELIEQDPEDYERVIPALQAAAQVGDPWSQATLGYCYEAGLGVERDMKQACWLYEMAAQEDYAPAQCNLAVVYLTEPEASGTDEQAVFWLEEALKQHYPRSQYLLGCLYQEGRQVPKNEKKAAQLFGDAAFQGFPPAQFSLAMCYDEGIGVKQNYQTALYQLEQAAAQDHVKSIRQAAYYYEEGLGVKPNLLRAVQYYLQGADLMDGECITSLAWCYDNGKGVDVNSEKAVRLYHQAAKLGVPRAMHNLAWCYKLGQPGADVPDRDKNALYWFQSALELGYEHSRYDLVGCLFEAGEDAKAFQLLEEGVQREDDRCIHHLADRYRKGEGVEQDEQKAAELYQKAAQLGNANAWVDLGMCYKEGLGVEQSDSMAHDCFEQAAEKNHSVGIWCAAYECEEGIGVEQNLARAVELYQRGADAGDGECIASLGWCYDNGRGVEEDSEKAVQLYQQAAELGVPRAMHNLAWCYKLGQPGADTPDRYEQAAHWFECALEQGYTGSRYPLVRCLLELGRDEQAQDLLEQGIQQEDERCIFHLAEQYRRGEGVEKDMRLSLDWYEKAAELGHPEAQFEAGYFWDSGCAGVQDYARAIYWYEQVMEQNRRDLACWAMAVNNLAELYRDGSGVPQDIEKAIQLYHMACDEGTNEVPWYNLGEIYHQERGDVQTGIGYYQQGIEHSTRGGRCALALAKLYQTGTGVAQNHQKARELAQLAFDRTEDIQSEVHEEAGQLLETLSKG